MFSLIPAPVLVREMCAPPRPLLVPNSPENCEKWHVVTPRPQMSALYPCPHPFFNCPMLIIQFPPHGGVFRCTRGPPHPLAPPLFWPFRPPGGPLLGLPLSHIALALSHSCPDPPPPKVRFAEGGNIWSTLLPPLPGPLFWVKTSRPGWVF